MDRKPFRPRATWFLSVVCAWLVPWHLTPQTVGAAAPETRTRAPATPAAALGLDDLLRLSLEQNPILMQAGLDIEAAQGRAVQAGLYPNPTLGLIGDEIGRRGGIYTLPQVSQEIVTAGKLRLGRSVAEREVDQASLALLRQRYALFTTVRQGYFELLAIQRRITALTELVKLATESFENYERLLKAKQISQLDLLQFEIEVNRLRADLEGARRELAAAWPRLTAAMGIPDLPPTPLAGSLDAPFPNYDLTQARAIVLEVHPEVRSAQVGITRAELALSRAQAEAVPNVTVAAGYQRNVNDRENEARYEVSVPIPVFNRNQGNIHAAQAELGRAIQEVRRVQNDLLNRLATAFGQYSVARQRAERYRTAILPEAQQAYQLALEAFRGGQFELLRVLQAQRAIQEANLEYIKALADAWQAAGAIAGLLLEEQWPLPFGQPGSTPGKCRAVLAPPQELD